MAHCHDVDFPGCRVWPLSGRVNESYNITIWGDQPNDGHSLLVGAGASTNTGAGCRLGLSGRSAGALVVSKHPIESDLGLPADRVTDKANELLELLSLRDARWSPISAYSKGMKQRVLIAAALLHDPDRLVFDEAQSGLDIANSLLFRHLLRTLAARGKAILYISHVLELVEKICEHIVVIYRGRIVADDSVSRLRDLMHLPNLEEIFTQLVEQDDMESRAQKIASVMTW